MRRAAKAHKGTIRSAIPEYTSLKANDVAALHLEGYPAATSAKAINQARRRLHEGHWSPLDHVPCPEHDLAAAKITSEVRTRSGRAPDTLCLAPRFELTLPPPSPIAEQHRHGLFKASRTPRTKPVRSKPKSKTLQRPARQGHIDLTRLVRAATDSFRDRAAPSAALSRPGGMSAEPSYPQRAELDTLARKRCAAGLGRRQARNEDWPTTKGT